MKQKSISISTYIIYAHPPIHPSTPIHYYTHNHTLKNLAQGHAGKPYMIWSQAYG